MANTEIPSGGNQAIKRWCDQLMRETFGKMSVTTLIGSSPESCIQLLTDLDKNPGDLMVFDFLAQDRSPGVNGDSRLKGFEAPLTLYQDDVRINQKRHAHAHAGMAQQRTLHDLRKIARVSLSNWWAWFIEASLFAHMAGVTGDGEETVFGALGGTTGDSDFAGNTITALDSGHYVTVGSSGDMEIGIFDDAVAKAKVQNPRIAPFMVDGRETYVAYLHPYQVKALRQETTGWLAIQKDAQVRGNDNPIFTGAVGVYNNVVIRESEFVPRVGTTSHGLMLGQAAGVIAMGNAWNRQSRVSAGGGGSYFSWAEDTDDYGNQMGVAAGSILGISRPMFNGKAVGVMGIRSVETAPS